MLLPFNRKRRLGFIDSMQIHLFDPIFGTSIVYFPKIHFHVYKFPFTLLTEASLSWSHLHGSWRRVWKFWTSIFPIVCSNVSFPLFLVWISVCFWLWYHDKFIIGFVHHKTYIREELLTYKLDEVLF